MIALPRVPRLNIARSFLIFEMTRQGGETRDTRKLTGSSIERWNENDIKVQMVQCLLSVHLSAFTDATNDIHALLMVIEAQGEGGSRYEKGERRKENRRQDHCGDRTLPSLTL